MSLERIGPRPHLIATSMQLRVATRWSADDDARQFFRRFAPQLAALCPAESQATQRQSTRGVDDDCPCPSPPKSNGAADCLRPVVLRAATFVLSAWNSRVHQVLHCAGNELRGASLAGSEWTSRVDAFLQSPGQAFNSPRGIWAIRWFS